MNGTLFAVARNGTTGTELWTSDGTTTGTNFVESLTIPENGSTKHSGPFAQAGGFTFFAADDGIHGEELWRTDGTEEGTVLVKDIWPGPESSDLTRIVAAGSIAYFSADNGTFGRELWRTDGTEAGTFMVLDLNPGSGSGGPGLGELDMLEFNGSLVFSAGGSLYITDGTEASTVQLAALGERPSTANGLIFFKSGNNLAISDGTPAGTSILTGPNGESPDNPQLGTNVGDRIMFSGSDEPWVSDGTSEGTYQIKEINPNGSAQPRNFTRIGDVVYFTATDGINGIELWKTDFTEAGTVMVKDINPGSDDSNPGYLVNLDGTLLFSANDGVHGGEVWISDGTEAGTVFVKEIKDGPFPSNIRETQVIDGVAYFQADSGLDEFGTELWRSDGTETGTFLVADLNPGTVDTFGDDSFTVINDSLYFHADNGAIGHEPHVLRFGDNLAPVADAGGPYNVAEGEALALDASASFDPDENGTLSYIWDINGDGIYDDAVGSQPTVSWQRLIDLGIAPPEEGDSESDGPGNPTFNVSVRVADGVGGAQNSNPATLTVGDSVPTANVTGPTQAVPGQTITVTLEATGGEGGLYQFDVDVDGDGNVDQTIADATSGTQLDISYSTIGTYALEVTATNASGTSTPATLDVEVTQYLVQADSENPELTNLLWGGTNGLDAVFFLPRGGSTITMINVIYGGLLANSVDVIPGVDGRIIAYGQGASDIIAAEFVWIPVELSGGNGNDILSGGLAGDLIDGGVGNDMIFGTTEVFDGADTLVGGDGRDFFYGNLGADLLDGGAGEDLLIAGAVEFTAGTTIDGLIAIRNEWLSSRDYATRVANISGTGSGPKQNGNFFLQPGQTIFPDTSADQLFGGADLDWFLFDVLDSLFDTEPGEEETLVP